MVITYSADDFRYGRNTVMGIATLLIVWFHSAIFISPDSMIGRLKLLGDIGVDMFLFSSGVGVYFALKKYGGFLPYIRGRLCRVLPAYLTVAIPWFAYHDIILGGSRRLFLKDILMISFWLDGRMTFWYISVVLLLYVVTPIYMACWNRLKKLDIICICLAYTLALLSLDGYLNALFGPAMIFIPRIPVYLMGLSFGKAMQEFRVFRLNTVWLVMTMIFCGVMLAAAMGWLPWILPGAVKYLAFGPAAIILSLTCAKIQPKRVIDFFGQRSLEIYLLLEKVQVTLGEYPEMEILTKNTGVPFFMLAFAITLMLSELLRWITYPFQRKTSRRSLVDFAIRKK